MSTNSDIDLINDAINDPTPVMQVGLPTEIELIRGLVETLDDGSQVWHSTAKFRELTGADEEALAGLETKKDITYTEYMNALLSRAVTHIGELSVEKRPGIVNKLILADRDMLFLGVVRATYGLAKEVRVLCPHCNGSNDILINLDEDFPVRYPDFDPRKPIEVDTAKGTYHLRLPNGEDTLEVQKNAKTDAEINTAMLARCAVFADGEEPADRVQWARDLNIGVRRQLVNALLAIKIGPDLEGVDTQCAHCDKNMPLMLDWVSLLLG